MKKDKLYKLFEQNKTDIFFETGTHLGYSVERAINIGYKEIHSIEIIKDRYNECLEKFKNNENVFLYLGDSLMWIPEILNTIDCRCTFWLDAHISKVTRDCPTLEELKLIGQHHIKDHIILIDDMTDFGTQAHEFITIDDLKNQILSINKSYKFSFESTSIPNNVLKCTAMQNINYNSVGVPQDEVFEHISIAKQTRFGIVELGILFGETTGRLCHANKAIPVYGIDPIIPDSMNPALVGNIQRIRDNTNGCGNFVFIKDFSYNIVKTWTKKFGYLFIDASHIYEDVKRDFEDWFKLLEPGGLVSLHDSACDRGGPHHWPGPSKLAKELFNDNRVEYIKTVYSLTIFKKL